MDEQDVMQTFIFPRGENRSLVERQKSEILFHALKRLTSCKWFYESTIRDCIIGILHERGLKWTDEEIKTACEKVKNALRATAV